MAAVDLVQQALAAGRGEWPALADGAPAASAPRRPVLLVGAAGPLGAAVLERLLAGGWSQVVAVAAQPMAVAMAGLTLHVWPSLAARCDHRAEWRAMAGRSHSDAAPAMPETAVVVFDRTRGRHGREAAFLHPDPARLADLARQLHRAGVRHLLVVLPHAPGLLPQALRQGLASLDEQAVASLGLQHVLFMKPARSRAADQVRRPLGDRLAHALLAQLHWMVPQREQPLRASKLAELAQALAAGLSASRPGTRVMPPEAVWDWAQPGGGGPWLQAWWSGQALPPVQAPSRRW